MSRKCLLSCPNNIQLSMNSHFFKPKKIETADNLILLPFFPQRKYLKKIEEGSIKRRRILGSVLYGYSDYEVLHGFLGYSNLLTLLEFISKIREKNVYFLGTAGSLNPDLHKPEVLNVKKVFPGAVFKHFTDNEFFNLNISEIPGMRNVNGISVDLIQREDPIWYENIKKMDVDVVEMEIFPLCWYMGKSVTAYVVLSDLISRSGISGFKGEKIGEESVIGFEHILESIK